MTSSQNSCTSVVTTSEGPFILLSIPLKCPLEIHPSLTWPWVPTQLPANCSQLWLPPPSAAVPSSAQPVLPPPFTLRLCSWLKRGEGAAALWDLCGADGPGSLLHPGLLAGDPVAALPSWQVVMNGRNEKAAEESPVEEPLSALCFLIPLMLPRFGRERGKEKSSPDYYREVCLWQHTVLPVLILSQQLPKQICLD